MKQYKYMTLEDRRELSRMYLQGHRIEDIAAALSVNTNTVYNEIKRGFTGRLDENGRREYSPELAQKRIAECLRRRGPNFAEMAVREYAAQNRRTEI